MFYRFCICGCVVWLIAFDLFVVFRGLCFRLAYLLLFTCVSDGIHYFVLLLIALLFDGRILLLCLRACFIG